MTIHPTTDDYDWRKDFSGSYDLALAEIRKRKIAAGEIKPADEAERLSAEGTRT